MRSLMLALAATSLAVPAAAAAHDDYDGKLWRDSQGRLRCEKPNGSVGLAVGAAGGAVIGRALNSRGARATGMILGAAAGALVGRQVNRSRYRCR